MMTPLPSTSADGSLHFDETGELINPAITPQEFDQTRLRTLGSLRLTGEGATFRSDNRSVFGMYFHVTLAFDTIRLRGVDLFPMMCGDSEGWAGWTHDSEMSRKRRGEEWASRVFGKALSVKPFVLAELPEPVFPANPGSEHPLHAVHPWGEVCSYFDGKAAFGGLWIRYREKSTPG